MRELFFNKQNSSSENHNLVQVTVVPNNFLSTKCSLMSIRDKWFINLSSYSISKSICCLLQLGDNFSLLFQ